MKTKIMDEALTSERPWIDIKGLEHKAMQLFMLETISPAEYRVLLKQLWSPDKENHVVAQELIMNKIAEL